MHRIINESMTEFSLGTANTVIVDEDTVGYQRLFVEVQNTGANSLSVFSVMAKAGPSGSDLVLYSTSGEFSSPAGTLIGTSSDLTALTGANTGWLELDVSAYWHVKLVAASANRTSVIPYGSKVTQF